MAVYSFEIGLNYAGRVNVETLSTTFNMAPSSKFYAYSESVQAGAGNFVTRGAPYAIWSWEDFIPLDMYNALRAICPAGSVSVIIRTLRADYTTYAYYSATMVWPPLRDEQFRDDKYLGFILRFDDLTVYTP